jgi:hypothetical protein
MWKGGSFEPVPPTLCPTALQPANQQWRMLEGFREVDELRQTAVVDGWRDPETLTNHSRL